MSILDPRFKYTPSVKTNVLDRYKAMGWTPPSEASAFGNAEDMTDSEYAIYVMSKCRDFIYERHGAVDQVEMLEVSINRLKEAL